MRGKSAAALPGLFATSSPGAVAGPLHHWELSPFATGDRTRSTSTVNGSTLGGEVFFQDAQVNNSQSTTVGSPGTSSPGIQGDGSAIFSLGLYHAWGSRAP